VERALDPVAEMPHDQSAGLGSQSIGRTENMLDEGETGKRMENLRPVGPHPRAFAGREDEDVTRLGHFSSLP
jgi:hypothetical protein